MVNFEKLIEKLTCIMLQQNNLGFVETWEKRGPSESPLTGHETTWLWWFWLAGINAARLINMQTAEGGGRALDWYINNTFLCYQTFGFAQLLAANRIFLNFTPPGHSYQ